jgi:hypothetical protein
MWEKTVMGDEQLGNLHGLDICEGLDVARIIAQVQAEITGDIAREQTAREIFAELERGFAAHAPEGDVISVYVGGEYWPILKAKWGVK